MGGHQQGPKTQTPELKKGGLGLGSDEGELFGLRVDVFEGGGIDRDRLIEQVLEGWGERIVLRLWRPCCECAEAPGAGWRPRSGLAGRGRKWWSAREFEAPGAGWQKRKSPWSRLAKFGAPGAGWQFAIEGGGRRV